MPLKKVGRKGEDEIGPRKVSGVQVCPGRSPSVPALGEPPQRGFTVLVCIRKADETAGVGVGGRRGGAHCRLVPEIALRSLLGLSLKIIREPAPPMHSNANCPNCKIIARNSKNIVISSDEEYMEHIWKY